MPIYVNYHNQRDAFRQFLHPESPIKVLLFSGQSGMGKTTLLNSCLSEEARHVKKISFSFRQGSDVDIAEIFFRTGEYIGWEDMTDFTQEINNQEINRASTTETAKQIQMHSVFQIGSRNTIHNVLQDESISQRQESRNRLTRAWFKDLHRHSRMVLFVFDDYERTTTEVQNWIAGPFLGRIDNEPNLRVVIAGQKIPDPTSIEWCACCQSHDLPGISEARYWKPFIEEKGRYIPSTIAHNPDSWLAGVCYALKGNPSKIIKVIEGLPLREDYPHAE